MTDIAIPTSADGIVIAGRRFASRLLLGTAGYPNPVSYTHLTLPTIYSV